MTEPGKKVAIEAPTYANIIPLLKYHQVSVVEIPMKGDGLNLDYFEQQLEKNEIALLYTIPNFHNPTGITTTQTHREKLLSLCEKLKSFRVIPFFNFLKTRVPFFTLV